MRLQLPRIFLAIACVAFVATVAVPASPGTAEPLQIDTEWLDTHLKTGTPRLVWQEGDEERIRKRMAEDPAAAAFHAFLIQQADGMLPLPELEREMQGRRLLMVSRAALRRVTTLSYAWRMTGDERYLGKLDEMLKSVCNFSDWNPTHFLDVAEMSLGVSIALDWTEDALPAETRALARSALKKKALGASKHPDAQWAFTAINNWNQVSHTGLVAAALVLAEEEPQLAVDTLNRMLGGIHNVLKTYGPDGVYVEGPMYWGYGTDFQVTLHSMLETALGTDFNLPSTPGFMESADFVHLMVGPSGEAYNFYDSSDGFGLSTAHFWFAMKTGATRHAQEDILLTLPDVGADPASISYRLAPLGLLWYIRYQPTSGDALPLNWVGHGANPLGVFRSAFNDPGALYLAFKGGKATNSHGNMDAGSFILELDGVRWAIDPGIQSYTELEAYFSKHGGNLWSSDQDSARWQLISKNNHGHSTLSIDGRNHVNDGHAPIIDVDLETPRATVELTAPLGDGVKEARRTFSVEGDDTVKISDRIVFSESPRELRWQLVTTAEVSTVPGGATLQQDGKQLTLEILKPEGLQVSVTSLNPPPHEADLLIPGLKRIDIVIPPHLVEDGIAQITVRLSRRVQDQSR